jgi:hypothetical protein
MTPDSTLEGIRCFDEWEKDESLRSGMTIAVIVQKGLAVNGFIKDAQISGFKYIHTFSRGENTFVMLERK